MMPAPTEHQVATADVLGILATHRGRANAVKASVVAAQLGLRGRYADRPVRDAIRTLRNEGYVILSATREPMGYFLCANRAEWLEYGETMRGRAVDLLATVTAMRRAVERQFAHGPAEQMKLW